MAQTNPQKLVEGWLNGLDITNIRLEDTKTAEELYQEVLSEPDEESKKIAKIISDAGRGGLSEKDAAELFYFHHRVFSELAGRSKPFLDRKTETQIEEIKKTLKKSPEDTYKSILRTDQLSKQAKNLPARKIERALQKLNKNTKNTILSALDDLKRVGLKTNIRQHISKINTRYLAACTVNLIPIPPMADVPMRIGSSLQVPIASRAYIRCHLPRHAGELANQTAHAANSTAQATTQTDPHTAFALLALVMVLLLLLFLIPNSPDDETETGKGAAAASFMLLFVGALSLLAAVN